MERHYGLRGALGKAVKIDRRTPAYKLGLRAATSVTAPLVAALLLDHHGYQALFPVIGALFVSTTDRGGRYSARATAVLSAVVVFSLAAFLGGLFTETIYFRAAALACWALVGGYVLGTSGSLIGVRGAIIFAVAALQPAQSVSDSLMHGAFVGAGGAWAAFLSLALWPFRAHETPRADVARLYRHLATAARDNRRAVCAQFSEDWLETLSRERLEVRNLLTTATVSTTVRRSLFTHHSLTQTLVLLTLHAEKLTVASIALTENARALRLGTQSQELLANVFDALSDGCDVIAQAVEDKRRTDFKKLVSKSLERLEICIHKLQSSTPRGTRSFSMTFEAQALLDTFEASASDWVGSRSESRTSLVELPTPELSRPFAWTPTNLLNKLRSNISFHSFALRTGLRLAVVVGGVSIWETISGWEQGVWVTLSVLALMKPEMGATFVRGFQLVLGTLVGALVAALLVRGLGDDVVAVGVVCVLLTFLMASLLPVNFAAWAVCVTPFVILLKGLDMPGNWELAYLRAANATLGAVIVFVATLVLWPNRQARETEELLVSQVLAVRDYLAAILNGKPPVQVSNLRRAAWRSDTNVHLALSHLALEPGARSLRRGDPMKVATLASRTLHEITSIGVLARRAPKALRNANRLGPAILDGLTQVARAVGQKTPTGTALRRALNAFEEETQGVPETFAETELARIAGDVIAMQRVLGSPSEKSLEDLLPPPVSSSRAAEHSFGEQSGRR